MTAFHTDGAVSHEVEAGISGGDGDDDDGGDGDGENDGDGEDDEDDDRGSAATTQRAPASRKGRADTKRW